MSYNFLSSQAHLVNPYDGLSPKRFACWRCGRDLPENQFGFVGRTKMRGGRSVIILHPNCFVCREQGKGKWIEHPLYAPDLDRYWKLAVPRLRAGATKRGLVFALDKDDILGIYLEQNGRCALTGMEMDWRVKGGATRGTRAHLTPSVDRKNSQGNYTLENVQIVCRVVNLMKQDMARPTFVEFCRRVVAKADLAHSASAKAA